MGVVFLESFSLLWHLQQQPRFQCRQESADVLCKQKNGHENISCAFLLLCLVRLLNKLFRHKHLWCTVQNCAECFCLTERFPFAGPLWSKRSPPGKFVSFGFVDHNVKMKPTCRSPTRCLANSFTLERIWFKIFIVVVE